LRYQQFVTGLGDADLPTEKASKAKSEADLLLHLFDKQIEYAEPRTEILDEYAARLKVEPMNLEA